MLNDGYNEDLESFMIEIARARSFRANTTLQLLLSPITFLVDCFKFKRRYSKEERLADDVPSGSRSSDEYYWAIYDGKIEDRRRKENRAWRKIHDEARNRVRYHMMPKTLPVGRRIA